MVIGGKPRDRLIRVDSRDLIYTGSLEPWDESEDAEPLHSGFGDSDEGVDSDGSDAATGRNDGSRWPIGPHEKRGTERRRRGRDDWRDDEWDRRTVVP